MYESITVDSNIPKYDYLNKTKKNKRDIKSNEKEKLWAILENDKNETIPKNTASVDTSQYNTCSKCKSELMIMDNDFPTCMNKKCGIIYKEVLDFSPEWSFYGSDDRSQKNNARCGNPINPLLLESSFGCKIMTSGKSSFEMQKIRKWSQWNAMPHREKALYDEFQFITTMARNAGIPKIFIDCAMKIHKDVSEQKMFRGLNRDGIKAASIYISCRLNDCPRNAHEIAEIFALDKASATYGCSMAVNILNNIERDKDIELQTTLSAITPMSFIDRFCSKLNMNQEMVMLCKFVIKKIEKNDIITNNIPHAIASGVIYFVSQCCNLNVSKKDVRMTCNVSEVTINKCCKKLTEHQSELIPHKILEKYKHTV
jgi:transcription initiation factor TFIIB